MRESIAADHPFVLSEKSPAEARAFLVERDQPFKVEIIDDLLADAERDGSPMPPTTFYQQGPFIDLCRGPHVASTGKVGPFKLLAVAGAYWRGDEKRPMLQRIYGTAWATQEELDQYLWRRAEAKKRDHRKLGVALDLFSFHDVSPGLRVLAPEGPAHLADARGRDARAPAAARLPGGQHADPRVRPAVAPVRPLGPLRREHVHRRVRGPALQPQADELPGVDVHLQEPSCARTATCRCGYNEYGRLHRNERSGTLSGLTRVRQFIQDDAHIYVRPDQLADEIEALLGEVREAYGWVGLDAALRVRDEAGQGDRRPGALGAGRGA